MRQKIFLVITIFLFAPFFCRAQEVSLGDFSVEEMQKILGSPIYFHVEDQKITADKNALAGLAQNPPGARRFPRLQFRSGKYLFLSDR